jgi:hypothetical protein
VVLLLLVEWLLPVVLVWVWLLWVVLLLVVSQPVQVALLQAVSLLEAVLLWASP